MTSNQPMVTQPFWPGKRVIVTGGSGFLGSFVVNNLWHRGAAEVIVPRRKDYDLRDVNKIRRLLIETINASGPVDMVIHMAANVGGIGANRAHPADFFYDNLMMGTQLMEQARLRGIPKFVALGTICAYPKFTPVPFSEDSLWQGYPEETNAPYGIAKLAQLVQLQANRDQYGQSAIYLMPTNLYGPGDKFHPSVSHVIPALIKKCVDAAESGADSIEVWGTGTASREFLYVDDAARGIELASEHYDDPDPVNLGTDHEVPIRDLVVEIAEATGFTGEIRWDPSKPDGQPRRRVDNSRARERFGFAASTSFADGLKATVEWYLANREAAEERVD